jgi:hypothetical protein
MPRRVLVLMIGILCCGQVARACSCGRSGPLPCGKLDPTATVFVGTVESIENPPPDFTEGGRNHTDWRTVDQGGLSRYHFRVDEKFSTTVAGEMDVYSGRGGADCSYHFTQGVQYLVYPYKSNDGKLHATICSDTIPTELAQPRLAVLRAMRDHQPVASLYGTLRSVQQPYRSVAGDYYGKPLPNTRMVLRSEHNSLETTTDGNGNYAFFDVPAGTYQVAANLPEHFEIAQTILSTPVPPIELPDKACYEHDVEVLPKGKIRGQVFGADGKPLAYAAVELFRRDLYPGDGRAMAWFESQDLEKPEFVFDHVAAGDYILVYNNEERIEPIRPYPRTFYPGVADFTQAQTIHVKEGEDVAGLRMQLSGGAKTRSMIVRLVAPGGQLPDVAYVDAKEEDGSHLTEQRISRGVFQIEGFPGKRYRMQGDGYCTSKGKEMKTPVGFIDSGENAPGELTLAYPESCPKAERAPGTDKEDQEEMKDTKDEDQAEP